MAIPGIPNNFNLSQGNNQTLSQWNISAGATSYSVQRSTDGVNYAVVGTPTATQFVDTTVSLGVQYWYQVASVQVQPVPAKATLTFTGQPTAGQSYSVANQVFTAVAAAPTSTQFLIGATDAATATNLAAAAAALPALVNSVVVTVLGLVVTFTAYLPGPEGNGIQFSSGLTNVTATPFGSGAAGVLSPYCVPQNIIPTPNGEMSLSELRIRSLQRADRLNSQFITTTELNSYINQSMFELYDFIIGAYEDYFLAPPVFFTVNGAQFFYPIPNGSNVFQDFLGNNITPPALYKLYGVDLAIQNTNNAFVTVPNFMFVDRNSFIYPNSASTLFGVFNLRYRMVDSGIQFIPTPSANQRIRLWYVPRLKQLLLDTDITVTSISGWSEFIITDVAIKILQKEESDVSVLAAQKQALILRIEAMASNRDQGSAERISDSRKNYNGGWDTGGSNSSFGGW
jgi:hypothetical protein